MRVVCVMSDKRKLTMSAGCPVVGSQNELGAGAHGLQLLQDVWFLRRLARLDRAAIPERSMYAKESGAYRTFIIMHNFPKYARGGKMKDDIYLLSFR